MPITINVLVDETLSLDCLDLGSTDEETQIATLNDRIYAIVVAAARLGECENGEINVRITDDVNIHEINRDYLQHDYPTDVISFPYELEPPLVHGELVISLETAEAMAAEHNVAVSQELLLYVAHGSLHLVGFDDTDEQSRSEMRDAECMVLKQCL